VADADRLVAANIIERGHLVAEYDADPAKIAVVPCGVDTVLFAPGDPDAARAALGLGGGPLLLYVGRIAPIKGLETLLDAVACLRGAGHPARLVVVGGDTDERRDSHEADLRRRAARQGLGDAVTFVGAQPQDRLREYYVAADATVLPSYYESFGMVALEAMACGTPVIATPRGAVPEVVVDGETGFIVPVEDYAEAAAEAVKRTVDLDPRALRRHVEERFSAEGMVAAYEAVYHRVLTAEGSG
jgi:D-inositol-3-phosphate glycosyltransferase